MRRFLLRSLVVGGAVAGAVAPLRRDRAARRALEHGGDRVAKRARYYRGVASGAWYRIRGRRPDPVVGDDVLKQRVLSALGPVEKHRDLPRVHVMVEQGFVILHSEVPTADDARELERRALEVSGTRALESYLGTVALAHPPVVADREKGSARASESGKPVGTHRVCGPRWL